MGTSGAIADAAALGAVGGAALAVVRQRPDAITAWTAEGMIIGAFCGAIAVIF